MKIYIFPLLYFFLSGCSSSDRLERMIIIEPYKKHTSDRDTAICEEFNLTSEDIKNYFNYAERLDSKDFHEQAIIFSCHYSGQLKKNGQVYHWEIYPAGAGYLFNDEVTENYLCRSSDCPASILGTTE